MHARSAFLALALLIAFLPGALAGDPAVGACSDGCEASPPDACITYKCDVGTLACIDGTCLPDPCYTTACF